jgi:hypothetical protein
LTLAGLPVVGSLVSGAAGLAAGAVLSAMAAAVSGAAVWLMDQIGGVITSTTTPLVGAVWFRDRYAVMLRLGLVLVVAFLLAGVIQAILRQDLGLLVRALVVQLPLALILSVSAVQLVQLSIAVTDQLSAAVSGGSGQDVAGFLRAVAGDLAALGPAAPAFIGFFVALLLVAGGFLLWLELVVRSAAVDAATLFLPLALATMVWPAASSVARRLVDVLAALVLAKPVVAAILSLGTAALNGESGFAGLVTGAALLLLATLAPAALLRMIPLAEFAAVTHLGGSARRAVTTAAKTSWTMAGVVAGVGFGSVPEVVSTDPVGNLERATWSGTIPGVDHPYHPGQGTGPEPTEPPAPLPPVGPTSRDDGGSDE